MKAKPNSSATTAAQRRFFEVFDDLKSRRVIFSISSFCNEYNLHRPKFSCLYRLYRDGTDTLYRTIELDAIIYLVRDYNASAEYILTGRGRMYRSEIAGKQVKAMAIY